MGNPIRVLVVDDSAFMRHTLSKHLAADRQIAVVGVARDGVEALARVAELNPDVVTLDVEMPQMDGLAALQRLMAEAPRPVIMLSSLTQSGAATTIRALMRGAVDFVAKPQSPADLPAVMDELVEKIKAAAGGRTVKPARAATALPPVAPLPGAPVAAKGPLTLRPFEKGHPLIIIGASTGGPRALHTVMERLPANLGAAVVIVQHMPTGFTRSLAQRLNEASPLTVQEAAHGDRLACGLALLAPGDYHIRFEGVRQIALDQGPRRNHVRPSVDVTMESAAEVFKSSVLGVVLTGMGSDGAAGAVAIKAAGGRVMAEHEATCVVYGMPRSVVEAGAADVVVPLSEVAPTLVDWVEAWKQRNTVSSAERF